MFLSNTAKQSTIYLHKRNDWVREEEGATGLVSLNEREFASALTSRVGVEEITGIAAL
jgi:hypothetical protein